MRRNPAHCSRYSAAKGHPSARVSQWRLRVNARRLNRGSASAANGDPPMPGSPPASQRECAIGPAQSQEQRGGGVANGRRRATGGTCGRGGGFESADNRALKRRRKLRAPVGRACGGDQVRGGERGGAAAAAAIGCNASAFIIEVDVLSLRTTALGPPPLPGTVRGTVTAERALGSAQHARAHRRHSRARRAADALAATRRPSAAPTAGQCATAALFHGKSAS